MELMKVCSKSPHFLNTVLACVRQVVIIVDDQGRILLTNEVVDRVFGYAKEDLKGKAFSELFCKEDLPHLYPNLLCISRKGKSFEGELTLVRRDGSRFFAYMVFRPYIEPDKKTPLTIACIDDIDEKKRTGESLRSTHYDDLVKIADGIAHELRNPLVIIGGSAKRMHDACAHNPEGKKYHDSIVNNVRRLEGLVQKVEYFAHLPKPSMSQQSVRRIMQEALQPCLQLLEENDIVLANQMEDTQLYLDRNLVVRAFSILLDNAIDALPQGGRLTIFSKTKDNQCQVMVQDDGVGIHPEDLPYIFNPFYRTKPAGVGIGLAVVRQIMRSHNGTVDVHSQMGEKTIFTLTFPMEKRRSIRVISMDD